MALLTESELAALGLTGHVPVGRAEFVALDASAAPLLLLGETTFGTVELQGNRLSVNGRPVFLSDILTEEAQQMRGATREALTAWLLTRVAPLIYSTR